ncbi:hypothetical protein F5Y15DRAFT_418885 [Xylariaceae sp. FL0016]|nr:hypothetical protein F5Y15DRAFT_418885 [Xylariaceae sp. FL0016]
MAANSDAPELQSRAQGIIAYAQDQLNRLVSPETRRQVYDSVAAFASARPLLASLILLQALASALPLLFFAFFTLSTLVFALLCALSFTLFWTGVALLFLVPTLFLAAGTTLLIWGWAVSTFCVGRWVWNALDKGSDGKGEGEGEGWRAVQKSKPSAPEW